MLGLVSAMPDPLFLDYYRYQDVSTLRILESIVLGTLPDPLEQSIPYRPDRESNRAYQWGDPVLDTQDICELIRDKGLTRQAAR